MRGRFVADPAKKSPSVAKCPRGAAAKRCRQGQICESVTVSKIARSAPVRKADAKHTQQSRRAVRASVTVGEEYSRAGARRIWPRRAAVDRRALALPGRAEAAAAHRMPT